MRVAGENPGQKAVAIIGMAGIFPQAPDIRTFWRNILAGVDAVGEPSPEWESARYLESGRINTACGGYLKDLYCFDPREFGIMPNSVDGGEPDQFLALRVARDALVDAGYFGSYDHRDTGIILGHSTYLHRGQVNHIQHHIVLDQTLELLQAALPSLDSTRLTEIRSFLQSKLPQSNADIAPSLVPNVMTGRIANRLDLKGPNYLIDAACSSSLLAVSAAVDELRCGRSRMMLAGGVNASLPAEVTVIFTQLGALSERGKVRPFEEGSDGTLLGEGLGILVLKLLSDAIADGDRIYAVIRGIGQSSDGRGHGLLAPSLEGEALALERAYRESGVDPATVELVEAHGTGIPLGDQTEISALKKIFGERQGAQGSIAIGSVKSMISHCIPAAGIAGMIKTALALHHKILPPTLCESVNKKLGIETTPFYVNTTTRPWITPPGHPRRAGINAFGFGGINTHAVLEEAPAEAVRPKALAAWPFELCVFSAADTDALAFKLNQVTEFLARDGDCSAGDIAAALAAQHAEGPHRLSMVVNDPADLASKIGQALKRLKGGCGERWATRNGICYSRQPLDGKLAFMFPGEGSQYLGMFADLALHFEEVRTWFDFWRGLYDDLPGERRTDILFPPQSELTERRRDELEKRLHQMDVGSEAVFVGGQAMHALLRSLGVNSDAMVGHSSGESAALAASGAMEADDLGKLADSVRELNNVYRQVLGEGKIPTGALLAVGALPRAVIEEHISAVDREIVIAMDNCSNQMVLFGDQQSMASLQNSLSRAGGICVPLPFDRGYHTPRFQAVSQAFLDYYAAVDLKAPRVPMYSCVTADLFPEEPQAVRELAAGQWSKEVRFKETIARMHRDGIRFFVEVGPSGNLSAFVNDILAGEEHLSLATNIRRKNDIEQFLTVLGHLYVNGKEIDLAKLFGSRSVRALDLAEGVQSKPAGMHMANTMPILHMNGGDRAFLQGLLATEERSKRSRAADDLPCLPELRGEHSSVSVADEPVMENYLQLMRSFLDQQRKFVENRVPAAKSDPEEGIAIEGCAPFLSSIVAQDGRRLEAECHLSVYEDNFLKDHVLSGAVSEDDSDLFGLSCVPLMVSLEIMAEACALLAGSTALRVIENIKAFNWIALDQGEINLDVKAEAIGAGSQKYRAHLLNDGALAATADFSFEADWRAQPVAGLDEKREYRWAGRDLYTTGMFHGPTFQSISKIDGWSDHGIEASLSPVRLDGFFVNGHLPQLVLNPVLLDATGQLAAFWTAQQVGTDFNSFPSTIERIELHRECPENVEGLRLIARQQKTDPGNRAIEAPRRWQFECTDRQGLPIVRVTNLENVFFPVPNRFYEFRRDPLIGWLGHPCNLPRSGQITFWQLPHFSEEFCQQSGGIFLRILAHALLGHEERRQWQELRSGIRQQRQWLLGRACLKEAVRWWIFQHTGKLVYPADIVVLHDGAGAPYVDGWWTDELIQAPEVSLSHDSRLCLAAVAPPGHPVGVDVEQLGRVQRPDLLEASLTPRERESLRGFSDQALSGKVLRMWCAKEAAAKFWGLGLQGMPEKFEVSFDDMWELAQVRYEDQFVQAFVVCENDIVIAFAA